MNDIQNILTIDLEDWYQTESYKTRIKVSDWDRLESRLVDDTLKILKMLKQYAVKATFFILAYNARRHPDIIRLIVDDGHEISSHGYYHSLVHQLGPTQFRQEVDYSKKTIEDMCKTQIIGFRAPNWSITGSCLWSLDILIQSGFCYDSSMDFSVFKKVKSEIPAKILEIPRSAITFFKQTIPFAGGFFLRTYPYCFTKRLIQKKNKNNEQVVVYIHPWECSQDSCCIKPRFPKNLVTDLRIGNTQQKFSRLLEDFKFNSIKNLFFEKKAL